MRYPVGYMILNCMVWSNPERVCPPTYREIGRPDAGLTGLLECQLILNTLGLLYRQDKSSLRDERETLEA